MTKFYKLYSLHRSGHHAIIFWILNNLGGVEAKHSTSVYVQGQNIIYFNDMGWRGTKKYYNTYKNSLSDYGMCFESYENILPSKSSNMTICILRDFVNMYASQKKKKLNRNIRTTIQLWKNLYKADDIILIKYNSWLLDKDYRDNIAKIIGIENINDDTSQVPNIGGGSSFINCKKELDIQRYISRYKFEKLTPNEIKIILSDKELIEIHKKEFDMDLNKLSKDF